MRHSVWLVINFQSGKVHKRYDYLTDSGRSIWIPLILIIIGSGNRHRVSRVHLTHWGRVTHICVSRLTITGSDNGLSPGRRQAIIWTNAGLLSIGPLGTNFSGNLIEILTFSFIKMRLKVSSSKWRPFCLGLNVLMLPRGPFTNMVYLQLSMNKYYICCKVWHEIIYPFPTSTVQQLKIGHG